jgi:hypothetical protein
MEIEWLDQPAGAVPPAEIEFEPWKDVEPEAAPPASKGAQENRPPSSASPTAASAPAARSAPTPPVRPTPAPSPLSPAAESLVLESRPFDFQDWVRRHRNAIAFAGVALLVLITVGYRIRMWARADLPEIAKRGRIEGLAALDEGRFDTAHQLLSKARDAVEALGDEVEGATEIRQGAAEAEIIAKLAESLEEILDTASSTDPKDWPEQFRRHYKGVSVIVDTFIKAVHQDKEGSRYELDYTILPNSSAVGAKPPSVGQIDATGLALLERLQPKVGDRIRFGARLEAFRFDTDREVWLAVLDPKSGVQMTHTKALEALNWPSEESEPKEEGRP